MNRMANLVSTATLANDIRNLHRSHPLKSEALIEQYLEESLRGMPDQKGAILEKLIEHFEKPSPQSVYAPGRDELFPFFANLLGERISNTPLSPPEFLEKLTQSFDTIFNTLNKIMAVIHTTLLGEEVELKTIRTRMGDYLQGRGELSSIQIYLDQIQNAFLIAHKAFQQAAYTKVKAIMTELDPDRLETSRGGLKIGPLRKAEFFEIYKDKFSKCKGWFNSNKFMEELLKEFEKTCQKLYNVDRKRG